MCQNVFYLKGVLLEKKTKKNNLCGTFLDALKHHLSKTLKWPTTAGIIDCSQFLKTPAGKMPALQTLILNKTHLTHLNTTDKLTGYWFY